MNNLSLIKKIIIAIFLFLMLYFTGCWEFLSIEQPEFADPNSTFEVPITVALESEEGSGRGHFGIRLPIGWTVEDSIEFNGILNGTFVYSSQLSDSMEVYESSPDGYYWWVGVSAWVDSLPEGNIYFTPRITADDQSAVFFIDYMISDRVGRFGSYVVHGGPYPISVNAPVSLTVTNTNDSGDGSLRKALSVIGIGGEITFDLSYPAVIELDQQLVIDRRVTITGPESGELIISGNNQCRVFEIREHLNVNLSNLTISDGHIYQRGGGLACFNSNLNLENIFIMNNYANHSNGGGLFCSGSDVTLRNTKIIGNTTDFGGHYNEGGAGGGIYCVNSSLSLYNVTISNNSASHLGGGIFLDDSSKILFDDQYRSSIYLNNALVGNDFYRENTPIVNVVLDTFSVLHPTSYYAFHPRNFTFDILNGKVTQYNSDLYVSTTGDNNNSGISPDDALKTIKCAFSRLLADSLNPHTVYIADGKYSPSSNGEEFPVRIPDYVSLSGESRDRVILDAESTACVIQISLGSFSSGPPLERCSQVNSVDNLTVTGGNEAGIQCWVSDLNLDNMIITANNGGGITGKHSVLNITNTVIKDNKSFNGGGIWCRKSEVEISSSTVSNNTAQNHGGGVYVDGSIVNLSNTRIIHNSARNGGGIRCRNSHLDLAGVTVVYNLSSYEYSRSGGGIWFSGNTINFDKENLCNVFLNESAYRYGKDILNGEQDSIVTVYVDTFTVLNPTEEYASPINSFQFDILNDASGLTDINVENSIIPEKFSLQQNYPNPFNPKTVIRYELPVTSHLDLSIYNILGQKVATLVNKKQAAGSYQVQCDASGFASGIYYYQLKTGDYIQTRKMVLIR